MSIARITTVQKSRKPGECEKCGNDLPVGSTYRHYKVGFRAWFVHKRCMENACTPRTSELESSLLTDVYAAMEDAEDQAASVENVEDAEQILSDLADAVREVAGQYEQASTNDNGDVFNPDAQERQEILESAAYELESTSLDGGEADCNECNGTGKIDCPDECHNEISTDTDGNKCEECQGAGEVECGECDGEGTSVDLDALREALTDAINGMELP